MERDWKLVTRSYSAPYFHTYPMRVSKNARNSHYFGQFFRRGRDAVSMFFESPENQGKDTLLYSITSTVVGWGLCGTLLLLFY